MLADRLCPVLRYKPLQKSIFSALFILFTHSMGGISCPPVFELILCLRTAW